MSGNGARWSRVEAALEGVLRASPEERAAMVDALCGDDAALRAEVESLLAAHRAADGFLEVPADRVAAPYLDDLFDARAHDAGRAVGHWRLVQEIGRGGMGTVWLAERADGEFDQRVAVKLVKRGMDTDEIVARFDRERRILARLDHPGIARILDGGATDDGRPWFVMEHVAGRPITAWCEDRAASVEERLELFERVCRAVQHAHVNLVVHRDLKPSNVLVSETGRVKLLDFGIARLLEEEDAEAAPLTRTGMRYLTADYASPEQVRGEAVTTQSDVYQLGLLLYELLIGRRLRRLAGKGPTEVERIVCHEDPPRPGSLALEDGDGRLARRLRGDLDTIVLAALRTDPRARYASAEALAEDVRRHLDGLPVRARGDRAGYRAGKFLRRHRVPVAAAAALVLLSTGFAGLYTVRLREERDRVRLEAEKATASAELLERFFVTWNPDGADPERVTARDVLDVAAARAERAGGPPEVRAATLSLMGSLYTELGAWAPAESLLARAAAIQRGRRGPPTDLAATEERMGHLRLARGDFAAAEERYRRALALRHAADGPAHERTLAAHASLATLYWATERFDRAEAELRRLLALHPDPDTLTLPVARAMSSLGAVLFFQGRLEESEAVLREALARQSRAYGHDDPVTLETSGTLAAVLRDQGELAEAERMQRHVLARLSGRYGEDHPRTLVARLLLAMVLERRAEYAEAEAHMREIVAEATRLYGPDHPTTGGWMGGLGAVLLDRGDPDAAEPWLHRSLEIVRRSEEAGDALNRIAWIRLRRGDPDAREAYLRAREFHRSRPPGDPAFVTDGFHFLAWAMHRMGDLQEAEALYRRAIELYEPALPADHPYVRDARAGLAALRTESGRLATEE